MFDPQNLVSAGFKLSLDSFFFFLFLCSRYTITQEKIKALNFLSFQFLLSFFLASFLSLFFLLISGHSWDPIPSQPNLLGP